MKSSIVLLLLVLLTICVKVSPTTSAAATLPGFKLRLTKKGLDYANSLAQTSLATKLKTLQIPDQSGHDGHIDWRLWSIQNRGVTIPSSAMTFAPAQNGVTWVMSNLGINLHADWRVKYKKGWVKLSTSGSVDLKVQRVSLSVTIGLAAQKGGHPSLSVAKCDASIGNVDVHFHGGTSFILNLFRRTIGDKVKKLMQDQVCKVVEKDVNVNANAKLSQLKLSTEIDHRFLLDYSLISAPAIHANDLETSHKGEVFWKTDVKEAPFSPKPIPPSKDESRMMYLWLTDYMASSAIYTAHAHKFLQYNLTQKDFPAGNKSMLNTTCKVYCVGKLIPQIGKAFPNSVVEARLVSLNTPKFSVTPQGISLALDVQTDLYAHTPKKGVQYLVTLEILISFSLKGAITNERFTGEITSHKITIKVIKSAVGEINPKALNLILGAAIDLAVIPEMNAILKQGFDLPVTGSVAFQNTQLTLLDGAVGIATDLKA